MSLKSSNTGSGNNISGTNFYHNNNGTSSFTSDLGGKIQISSNYSNHAGIHISDDVVKINDKLVLHDNYSDVKSRLERLEKVLNLHKRDEDLEASYPDLKALGDIADQCIQDHLMSLGDSLKQLQKTYKRYQAECELMEKLKRE